MTNYYLICDTMLVKGETSDSEFVINAFVFDNDHWEPFSINEINDRIIGYDPSEDCTAYSIGNTSVMSELRKITKEEAEELCSPYDI